MYQLYASYWDPLHQILLPLYLTLDWLYLVSKPPRLVKRKLQRIYEVINIKHFTYQTIYLVI